MAAMSDGLMQAPRPGFPMDLAIFLQPAALLALAGLVALELVLAVDNLIFITIVTNRLPPERQPLARRLGLLGAVVTRILLLIRSEEHTSELQSLMRISYAVFCLKKKITQYHNRHTNTTQSANHLSSHT